MYVASGKREERGQVVMRIVGASVSVGISQGYWENAFRAGWHMRNSVNLLNGSELHEGLSRRLIGTLI